VRIDSIELRLIEMELIEPFETSGWRETKRPAIIVILRSEGMTGYGECVAGAGPWYSYETVGTAWQVLTEFAIPLLLGENLKDAEDLQAKLRIIRGHPMAKAALEAAVWDLQGKRSHQSLAQLLGGTKKKIESGISIGIQPSPADLLTVIQRRVEQGYRRIKIKIKPGWDWEIIGLIRDRFPDLALMADANAAYTSADIDRLKKLDAFHLVMLEQPLGYEDILEHARLQKQLQTPICLDESVTSLDDARTALELEACQIVNIKPARVGGLLNAKKIHDLCQSRNIPVWCGGMLETGIGRAANVAIASLPNYQFPNDISASSRYWKQDIIEPEFVLNPDATLTVRTEPGIGVGVVQERLDRFTQKKQRFEK
jgi:O-succinylbenzoate synthase